jgi:hypothetical protein
VSQIRSPLVAVLHFCGAKRAESSVCLIAKHYRVPINFVPGSFADSTISLNAASINASSTSIGCVQSVLCDVRLAYERNLDATRARAGT